MFLLKIIKSNRIYKRQKILIKKYINNYIYIRKEGNKEKMAVHNGTFHADDVFGVAIYNLYNNRSNKNKR